MLPFGNVLLIRLSCDSVKPDFATYSEASKAVREILLEVSYDEGQSMTPLPCAKLTARLQYDDNMSMAGMDEGYLK